jgi:TonB family protein
MTTRSLLRWLSLAFFASTFFVTTSVHAQGAASDDAPLTKRPVLSHFVMAPYPDGALAAKAEAVVVMEIDVDANGNVENVRSLGQQGGGDFDFVTPAVEAAKQFQFEPAEAGGATVPVTITYKYKFVLPKLGEISGVVLDRRTNQPIDAAHVIATVEVDGKWLKVEATTSANGRFDFKGLPPGSWKAQTSKAIR